jgi:hypothetical protein
MILTLLIILCRIKLLINIVNIIIIMRKAQESVPVQYTADIIDEIKNRDGTVMPMRVLLDTGTTSTIILR